jgi:hypothetical protein
LLCIATLKQIMIFDDKIKYYVDMANVYLVSLEQKDVLVCS